MSPISTVLTQTFKNRKPQPQEYIIGDIGGVPLKGPDIKGLKDKLCTYLEGEDSIVYNAVKKLNPDILEEILNKVGDHSISCQNLIARVIALDSLERATAQQKIQYNFSHDLCKLPPPWKLFDEVSTKGQSSKSLTKSEEGLGVAFQISRNDIEEGLRQIFLKGESSIADCSLIKQLCLLRAIVYADLYDYQPIIVHNESVQLNGGTKNQTVYKYLQSTNIGASIVDRSEYLIPGDSVYFENDPTYPQGCNYAYSGEHAFYLGNGKFQGFGLEPCTFEQLLKMLENAHKEALTSEKLKVNKHITPGYPRMSTTILQFPNSYTTYF